MSRFSQLVGLGKGLSIGLLGLLPSAFLLVAEKLNAAETGCRQPLPDLFPALLTDLPSYTNRAAQRQAPPNQMLRRYLLLAGKPEYTPLALSQQQVTPLEGDTTQQIFFSTLENRYTETAQIRQQNFYWALFVLTDSGWRLTLLYEQPALDPIASGVKTLPQSSPVPTGQRQEVGQSPIAEGIRLWLRDCRAGLKPEMSEQSSE